MRKKSRRLTTRLCVDSPDVSSWIKGLTKTEDVLYGCPLLNYRNVKNLLAFKMAIAAALKSKQERKQFYLALYHQISGTKVCIKCGMEHPAEQFNPQAWPHMTAWKANCGSSECVKLARADRKMPADIGARISKAKLVSYQTPAGKDAARRIGKTNSDRLKQFYQTEHGKNVAKAKGKKISISHKAAIAAGHWTPGVNNRWTRWNAIIEVDGITRKFRSSWEACFWYCNQSLNYETFRCSYIDSAGDKRTYIGDFYDAATNTLYELKPTAVFVKEQVKMSQVIEYCKKNEIRFILVTEKNLMNYLDTQKIHDNESVVLQYTKVLKNV
jgi:hypothetical protein